MIESSEAKKHAQAFHLVALSFPLRSHKVWCGVEVRKVEIDCNGLSCFLVIFNTSKILSIS